MKKSFAFTVAVLLIIGSLAACEKREETTVVGDTSGTSVSTETTVTTDTATTQEMANDANRALENTEDAARDAAKATGTAMETTGEKIQEHAKPGNQP